MARDQQKTPFLRTPAQVHLGGPAKSVPAHVPPIAAQADVLRQRQGGRLWHHLQHSASGSECFFLPNQHVRLSVLEHRCGQPLLAAAVAACTHLDHVPAIRRICLPWRQRALFLLHVGANLRIFARGHTQLSVWVVLLCVVSGLWTDYDLGLADVASCAHGPKVQNETRKERQTRT